MSGLREKIYRYTYQRLKAGDPPTIREVQKAVGLKAVESARGHLEALVEEGRLVKRDTNSRSYALPPEVWSQVSGRKVPIVGEVQAGALTLAIQEAEGFVETERQRKGEVLFALRVKGLSMRDAGILPGDLLITRRQESADMGDIVVALVEDEATVKRLRFKEGKKGKRTVVLQPENPDFEAVEVDPEELKLLGKVLEVRRYYETVSRLEMEP
jgi:repressor LexA